MIQLDLQKGVSFVKKYAGWILAICLLLWMNTCQTDHSGAIAEREKDNKQIQKKSDSLLSLNITKDKQIANFEKAVIKYDAQVTKLKEDLEKSKVKAKKEIAKVENYNLKDWQKFYENRTNSKIEATATTLNFKREPLVAIGKDLVAYDYIQVELQKTNIILENTQLIIVEKDKIIETEREKSVNLLSIVSNKEQIESNLNKNISDLKADLKSAKKPKLVPILLGVAAGVVTGVIISK